MANFSQNREIDLLMEEKELDQQHIKELEKKIQELSDTNKQLTETNDQLAQTMDRKSVQMTKIARHNSQYIQKIQKLEQELDHINWLNKGLTEAVDLMYCQEQKVKNLEREIKNLLHDIRTLTKHADQLKMQLSIARLLRKWNDRGRQLHKKSDF